MSDHQAIQVIRLIEQGYTYREIGDRLNIHFSRIAHIIAELRQDFTACERIIDRAVWGDFSS